MPELFRREALDHATRRVAGEVIVATPVSMRILGSLLIICVLLALIFASLATYSRKETVLGWVVPQGGLIRVTANQAGWVERLQVREGAMVTAGTPLLTIRFSNDVASGDAGEALAGELSSELLAQKATAAAIAAKTSIQNRGLINRRAILRRELTELRSRQSTMEQRQKIAETEVVRGQELVPKGYIAPQALDQLKFAALTAAQAASETRSTLLGLEQELTDLDSEIATAPATEAAAKAAASQAEANFAQRKTTTEAQNLAVAVAPIAGRVLAIPTELGQSVHAGTSLAVISPSGTELNAELYVPSRAAAFIKSGQQVRLKYQAFPYQTFGTGLGSVQSVSRTVLAPSEIAISGIEIKEPVFRVRVKLAHNSVSAYGRDVPLQPGMLLNADIILERQSLIRWLLDPIYAVSRRS